MVSSGESQVSFQALNNGLWCLKIGRDIERLAAAISIVRKVLSHSIKYVMGRAGLQECEQLVIATLEQRKRSLILVIFKLDPCASQGALSQGECRQHRDGARSQLSEIVPKLASLRLELYQFLFQDLAPVRKRPTFGEEDLVGFLKRTFFAIQASANAALLGEECAASTLNALEFAFETLDLSQLLGISEELLPPALDDLEVFLESAWNFQPKERTNRGSYLCRRIIRDGEVSHQLSIKEEKIRHA